MPLSALDDYLVHQYTEPVRHIATSDRNFFDRYYFNLYSPQAKMFVVFGMGQYPNLATQDGFVLFGNGQAQTVLRSSRILTDRLDTSCGPISITVEEGLRKFRIVVGPNEADFECDVTFNGVHEPSLEPRNVNRVNGRVMHDILRYNQVGFYDGYVVIDGEKFSSDEMALRGYRDRSWGIRPVGEVEPDGVAKHHVGGSASSERSFQFIKIPVDFGEYSLHINVIEDNSGRRSLDQAELVWHDGRPREDLASALFDFQFSVDRRYITKATVRLKGDAGNHRLLHITPLTPLYIEAGTGYGRGDKKEWTHGAFRGDAVTDTVIFDYSKADRKLCGGIDAFSKFEFEGRTGYGLFEYSFFGKLDRFQFSGPGFFNQL